MGTLAGSLVVAMACSDTAANAGSSVSSPAPGAETRPHAGHGGGQHGALSLQLGRKITAISGPTKSEHASTLLEVLERIKEPEFLLMMIPGERAIVLRRVSKAVRTLVDDARPTVQIKATYSLSMARLEHGLLALRWCRVTVLDLAKVGIGDMGAGQLAAWIKCKGLQLTRLDLGWNLIGVDGTERLASELVQCRSLTNLNFACNHIGNDGVGRLVPVLRQCRSLALLNLNGNGIRAEGADHLAAVLPQCPSLAILDLACNAIGDGGLGRLAEALKQCPSIAILNLQNSCIGERGAARLVAVLVRCQSEEEEELDRSLECLDLGRKALKWRTSAWGTRTAPPKRIMLRL